MGQKGQGGVRKMGLKPKKGDKQERNLGLNEQRQRTVKTIGEREKEGLEQMR